MSRTKLYKALCILNLWLFSAIVYADEFPNDDFWDSFDGFFIRLSSLKQILVSPGSDLYTFVVILSIGLSIIMIVLFLVKFISDGVTLFDVFALMFSVILPKLFLNNYDVITSEGWGLAMWISQSFQVAAIGDDSLGGIYGFVDSLFTNIEMTANTIDPIKVIIRGFLLVVFSMLFEVFMVGVAIATMWGIWGYAIATIIGLIFVPMAITPWTRPFFINWIKFYLGYLFYYVIARLNLVVVYLLIISIFNLPVDIASTGGTLPVYTIDVTRSIPTSLVVMLLVGIISMFSIGSMAASLVSGGSNLSSGMGRMVARKVL